MGNATQEKLCSELTTQSQISLKPVVPLCLIFTGHWWRTKKTRILQKQQGVRINDITQVQSCTSVKCMFYSLFHPQLPVYLGWMSHCCILMRWATFVLQLLKKENNDWKFENGFVSGFWTKIVPVRLVQSYPKKFLPREIALQKQTTRSLSISVETMLNLTKSMSSHL